LSLFNRLEARFRQCLQQAILSNRTVSASA
jgi:hypothetical protein